MVIKHYIFATLRTMMGNWWLSIIKIFSLTTGIISFMLIWLFYLDRSSINGQRSKLVESCSWETILIIVFILLFTSVIYFLVMKSQISIRQKELFWRRYYGETSNGIISMVMMETAIFIIISFVLGLVLVDQVAPLFNMITAKNISLRQPGSVFNLALNILFLFILGFACGILPAIWYARNRAVDILKILPD